MQIEGIPDGCELVRIGVPELGEWIIGNDGGLHVVTISGAYCYPIIRKVERPKQYRPFANAEEFKPHRDRWVRCVSKGNYYKIVEFQCDDLYIGRGMSLFSWAQAFSLVVFDDGTPFGVEVTE
jgi:hypothetical protein